MDGFGESVMAKRYTLRLLLVAAITSIVFCMVPAFAATPGTWGATAEFGTLEFVVNGAGTGIEQIKFKFSSYTCGIVTYGDYTITILAQPTDWPISNSEFSITVQTGSNETMTTTGVFESSSQASGTFRAEFYDTVCTGTWSTSGGGSTNYTLSVSKSGSGSGTVTSSPSGINCGSTCSASFASGTNVTLTANPASGSTFGGWSGSCSGTGSCSVSMTQARSVTASFNASASAPADLALTMLDAQDGTYAPGDTLVVENKTENIGGTVSDSYRITFYASTNATISSSDIHIGFVDRGALNPGSIHHFNTSPTLPSGMSSGQYYIGAILTINDANSANNSNLDSTRITISGSSTLMIDATFSGLWYNPDQDGHGFSISVHSATSASVYWYTFSPFGSPIWIYGAGDIIVDRIESSAYFLQGMEFGTWDPDDKDVLDWGIFDIEFHSCNSATLTYDSTLSYQSGEEFGSGTIPLVRLASIDGLECQ